MRFGCCGSMISPSLDPIGIELIEVMAEVGFDYAELSLADLMNLTDAAFDLLVRRVDKSGIHCEACNNFFPARIRLTGTEAQPAEALDYARAAIERAARLGVKRIAFGSSGAKNVPAGFPHDAAWRQLIELLQSVGQLAEKANIIIVIEPLNQEESNIVNLISEGLRLVNQVNHPCVQLLIDFYHFMKESEDPAIILQAGPVVRHLHFANAQGRIFPQRFEDEFVPFFNNLQKIGYSERCSIEAYSNDFMADAPRALRVLLRSKRKVGRMVKMSVGGCIRRLRLEQQRTQQDIANACGFTKSLLSKIESNKVMPPVATLVKIAESLGTKVSTLIETDDNIGTVYTAAKEVEENIVKTERGYWIYPFATSHKGKRMQPFVFIARKGEVKQHHLMHEGEEFIYVLKGEMRVQVGQAEYRLKTGYSLYFNSAEEHQVIPISDTVRYLNVFV